MLPDQVSNPGPLTYESDALPTALRGPAFFRWKIRIIGIPEISMENILNLNSLGFSLRYGV